MSTTTRSGPRPRLVRGPLNCAHVARWSVRATSGRATAIVVRLTEPGVGSFCDLVVAAGDVRFGLRHARKPDTTARCLRDQVVVQAEAMICDSTRYAWRIREALSLSVRIAATHSMTVIGRRLDNSRSPNARLIREFISDRDVAWVLCLSCGATAASQRADQSHTVVRPAAGSSRKRMVLSNVLRYAVQEKGLIAHESPSAGGLDSPG